MSDNTVMAYRSDIRSFMKFASERGHSEPASATNTDIVAFLTGLRDEGRSGSTINRKLTSLRVFYRYMKRQGLIGVDPTEDIKSPKAQRKHVDYLTVQEVNKLLSMPDDSTPLGARDKALLEVMYATGVRVSEVVDMMLSDVDMRMGFVKLSGTHGMARIVPMGGPSKLALKNYVEGSRKELMKDGEPESPTGPLFVNFHGEAMTRQGCWKIMRQYGDKAGIKDKLTPQALRNSFAIHMAQNGIDIVSLQELMGHEDISATQAYFRETHNRIKDIYDRTHPRAGKK